VRAYRGVGLAQNPRRRKKSANPETATERAARLSARIGGRYAIVAAVAGAVVASVAAAAATSGFGLLERASSGGTQSSASGTQSNSSGTGSSASSVKYPGQPARIDLAMVDESRRADEIYVLPQKLMLTARELRQLNQLSPGALYDNWFRSRGGVGPDESVVKIVIEGNRPYHVQVVNMGITEHCGPPLTGTLFYNAPAGGPNPVVGIDFNLDLPRPFPQNGDQTGSWFQQHTIDLGPGESQTLEVVSYSSRYCEYSIALTVVDGVNTVTEIVADHGRPFQVSGLLQAPAHYKALYVGGTRPRDFAPFIQQNPESRY
jgi:hypothetical protein